MSDWLDEERRASGLFAEAARLWRRARARPFRALAPAVLLALAAAALRWQPTFTARVVVRVSETDLDASTGPPPVRDLIEHVAGVAFADRRLLDVIRAEHLYARQLARGERLALEAMRDDIDVEVWHNEFLEAPDPEAPARSARVAISYRAKEPASALRVARSLAGLIAEEQHRRRIEATEPAARAAEEALDDELARLMERRAQAARMSLEPPETDDLALRAVALARERRAIVAAEEALRLRERDVIALERRRAIERSRLGLQVEIVDEEPPPPATRPIGLGLAIFLLALPVSAIFAGAFDTRVHDREDVEQLGLVALGEVRLARGAPPSEATPAPSPAAHVEGRPDRPVRHVR